MYKDYILDITPRLLAIVAFSYLFLKLFFMIRYRVKKSYAEVLTASVLNISKAVIKNTNSQSLKRYYIASNRINKPFYIAMAILLIIYMALAAL